MGLGKHSVAAAVAMLAAIAALAADELPGRWLDGKAGERDYKLYVPASYRGAPAPLVVMLHGCLQGPDAFADSTRVNRIAESAQFLVLYPSQKVAANPTRCWNWFLPENQARDAGEPAAIVAAIGDVSGRYAVDRHRVYVAGLSAGASMSVILAACYPDVFAAAAVQGGTMYKAAQSLADAGKVMRSGQTPAAEALAEQAWNCGGQRRLTVPIMVWQGDDDDVVNPVNGDEIVRQFARLDDWADDGRSNGSAPQPAMRSGARVADGHAYILDSYAYKGRPLIEHYRIAGMGHAWSGGRAGLPFSDAKGPDASLLMWNFFRQFSR